MNRYSISQQIRAEAAAEATAETTARIFFQMLPSQFELMEFRPSYKSELIELGQQCGISEELIEKAHAQWLKDQAETS